MLVFEMLRTDYADAVFDGLRKYLQIINPDGTFSFVDVTQYTVKEGAFFGAKDANKINTAVNAILTALNNGTDLYEVFSRFFAEQQELFTQKADEYNADFFIYVMDIKETMDAQWSILSKDYMTEIERFEKTQEVIYNTWFDMMKDKLSEDAAGKLQLQVTQLQENIEDLHEMLLSGMMTGRLLTDEGDYLIDDLGNPLLIEEPICNCQK